MSRAREIADRDLAATELILDADNDTSITADTDDRIDFKTGGTDRMKINSNGSVGIGSDVTTSDLNIGKGINSNYTGIQFTSPNTATGTIINFGDSTDDDYSSITAFASNAGENGRMRFIAGTKESLNILNNGTVTVTDGDLKIGTSGHGIDFSATGDGFASAGSELLDDYEEGAYNFSTNGFSQQTTNQGFYVRIGKMCHVTMAFHALGSQNSNTFTNSLPFTAAANQYSGNSGYGMNCVWPIMSNNCDTGTAGLRAFVVANTNYIKIYKENEDGAWAAVSNNFMSSEDQFYTSGWFVVA
tara:strand:- start:45 stop:947 length:903 start_codon:yes stop_codon:yes gene_type:complete